MLHQQMRQRRDIGEDRHVAQRQRLLGEEGGGHKRQGGVLRPADRDGTGERLAAPDTDPVHGSMGSTGSGGGAQANACSPGASRFYPSPLEGEGWGGGGS